MAHDEMRGLVGMLFSKRRDSKYRSGPSTNWLKAKCYAIDDFDLLGVEREAGKPAMETRPGALWHGAQGHHEAAGHAMGKAGRHWTREAPARRG
ncbi:hypothetical protein [Mesorhizobium sp. L103C105A0]|uniref:hypothetical protein n=1 Tax=unclassified Mesorhizobium TaxID=325217 RepID=UPI001FD94554|nr:hypothetical protein [Mesorhizobium sp. L103C105A0]